MGEKVLLKQPAAGCFQAQPTQESPFLSHAIVDWRETLHRQSRHGARPPAPPTQFAGINAAAARVRPGRATDSPRETPPVGHLTRYGSTFLSHSITIPRTHIRRCDTSKRAQMHAMMHYYNEKWHVQGPQAPLNQRVGGNSTDLLKTSDVLMVFGC